MQRKSPFEAKQVEEIHEAVIDSLANLGLGQTLSTHKNLIKEDLLQALLIEALRIPSMMRRTVPAWHKTQRATLFPIRPAVNSPLVARTVLNANVWAPQSTVLAKLISAQVGQIASWGPNYLHPLFGWQPNRIGFNYMQGTPSDPASIPPHTDVPEETGLVIALDLNGDETRGDLSFIFGADVCNGRSLPQPIHQAESKSERISLTVARLLKPIN